METEDEVDGWAGVIQRVGRDVLLGGEWRPPNCEANSHLAVIIPCRDRDTHLRIMLRHLIPILQRQLTHFRIFVVEQVRCQVVSYTHRAHCQTYLGRTAKEFGGATNKFSRVEAAAIFIS